METVEESVNKKTSQTNSEVIKITDLHKSFGENDVLKGVNVNLRKSENLVVLGKSGTGKSVLIKCIAGLIVPDQGEVIVLGKNVPGLRSDELNMLRVRLGFLFQSAALYDSMTVRENLLFPLERHLKKKSKKEFDEMVNEVLENVGLKDAIDKMPSELSGGMRKRIGLARTLILKPEIMLYDEPTTGLDPITSGEISKLILDMQKKYNISSIIITHDILCAKTTADRMVVLKEGVIAAEGTYQEMENSEDEWLRSFFK